MIIYLLHLKIVENIYVIDLNRNSVDQLLYLLWFSYNKDKKTEKTQDQCSQLCDRYVTKETYSSYSSPVFVVNKNPKELAKYVEELLPKTLRRSPRKAVRRTNKGLQIQTMGVRSSPRKRVNKMAEGQIVTQQPPTKKVNKQFSR